MEDVDQLIAAAGSGYSGKVWIGLYDNSSSWAWSMTDDGFYGTNNEPYIKWANGQPNDRRDQWKLCGSVVNSGLLVDMPCLQQGSFLCYDNSDASSPPRYVYKSWDNLTWEEVQSYCRKFHTDLTSIRNEEEWTQIKQVMTNTLGFIGLSRRTWYSWSDGTEHEFKNFLPGRLSSYNSGDCAASLIGAADAGKWVEDHCDQKLPFMCHYEKKQFRIKLRFLKSTMDLNDPAVTEAILKELEKKLKEKGIKAGFKLRLVKKPDNTTFQEEKDEL